MLAKVPDRLGRIGIFYMYVQIVSFIYIFVHVCLDTKYKPLSRGILACVVFLWLLSSWWVLEITQPEIERVEFREKIGAPSARTHAPTRAWLFRHFSAISGAQTDLN